MCFAERAWCGGVIENYHKGEVTPNCKVCFRLRDEARPQESDRCPQGKHHVRSTSHLTSETMTIMMCAVNLCTYVPCTVF